MILLLSNKWDLTVDFVVAELRARHRPFVRLNAEDLVRDSARVTLPELTVQLRTGKGTFDLSRELRVVWYRRPGRAFDDRPKPDRPTAAIQRFVDDQWLAWLEVLQLLPGVTWVNHPRTNDAMESKLRQLALAARVGFNVPRTLVSNDLADARAFVHSLGGRAIVKALSAPLIEAPDQDRFIFSNQIGASDLSMADADALRLSPAIFQEAIVPKTDYRVTVVDQQVFAVKVVSRTDHAVALDWRTQEEGLAFVQCDLPPGIEHRCRRLVQSAGLVFGAIDLVERNDEFFFLEINPNGEWGWLQKPNNVPIAEALTDVLIAADAARGAG